MYSFHRKEHTPIGHATFASRKYECINSLLMARLFAAYYSANINGVQRYTISQDNIYARSIRQACSSLLDVTGSWRPVKKPLSECIETTSASTYNRELISRCCT